MGKFLETKRGLPHAYLLYILNKESDPFDTSKRIDSCVSAEISKPEENLWLHKLVMNMMIDGPCKDKPNLPCREDEECSKKFPKHFLEETQRNVGSIQSVPASALRMSHYCRDISSIAAVRSM